MTAPTPDPALLALLEGKTNSLPLHSMVEFECIEIGSLTLPTGRIVVCDPLTIWQPEALSLTTPTGRFPVQLFIAHYDNGDQRVAAARLTFAPGSPDWWDLALLPDQVLSVLEPGQFFGYGVDSGTGSFMDLLTAKALETRMSCDHDFFIEINRQMDETYVDTRSWAMLDLGDNGNTNAAVFSSGAGDGVYPSFWGWSDGDMCCLVTDFGLFPSSGANPLA